MDLPFTLPTYSSRTQSLEGLTRREAVRRFLGGVGAPFALPLVATAHPATRHLMTLTSAPGDRDTKNVSWSPQFLSLEQDALLVAISERMLPGAGAAHVNRTIDTVMTIEAPEQQKLMTQARDTLDKQAEKKLQARMANLSPHDIDVILSFCAEQEASRTEYDDDPSAWKLNGWSTFQGTPNPRDCFEYLKGWIVASYYSSEIGLRELGWSETHAFESPSGCGKAGEKHVAASTSKD
jgi:hypothetical protein